MNKEIVIQFLLAALWGGIVGLEREYRSKSAGFRTMIMISTGACFFTIMSKAIGDPGNPDRIASNIVTGIGFLGAGVIFRGGENRVSGITTAATIWTVAAVGMGIGAGYYFAAASASALIIFVLAVLPYAESRIDKISQTRTYVIQRNYSTDVVHLYETIMKEQCLKYKRTNIIKEKGMVT
ncbi:MAG: MgtC/SapB family protein, partial [Bacteroidota bacterium]